MGSFPLRIKSVYINSLLGPLVVVIAEPSRMDPYPFLPMFNVVPDVFQYLYITFSQARSSRVKQSTTYIPLHLPGQKSNTARDSRH